MKIHKIEEDINVHVIKNTNFSYDVLLGLDAIQKFRLIQDDNLNVLQRINDQTIEKIENVQENKYKKISNYVEKDKIDFTSKVNHLGKQERVEIFKIITSNSSAFAENKYDIGQIENQEAHIKLIENKYISKKNPTDVRSQMRKK